MRKKYIKKLFFIPYIILTVIVITTVIMTIVFRKNENKKYVTIINKNDIVFENLNTQLKYFYEPKQGNQIISHPDWLGYDVRNNINKDSLNERFDYPLELNTKTFRIITLGDSYTFGHNVDTDKNYSEVLEDLLNSSLICKKYNHFEVINLGVNGYDIKYPVERLIRRGFKYNPDLVIWLIHDWNFDRINELMIPIEEKYKEQGTPDFNLAIGGYEAAMKAFADIKNMYGVKYILDYQKKAFRQFSDTYKGKLIIISIEKLAHNNQSIVNDFLKLNSDKFSFVFLSNGTLTNKQRLLDGHPNEKGHQIIADALYNYLKKATFPACDQKNGAGRKEKN